MSSPHETPDEKPGIILSRTDYERLDRLISGLTPARREELAGLQEELDRAELVEPDALPASVVRLGSEVRFRNEDSGEELSRRLGFPADTPGATETVSILSPAGAALLGLSVGQTINWQVGDKQVSLRILAVG